jgi:predicted nucleic acid-binding protein
MKQKNIYKLYVDTSVFGGCFDDNFRKESKKIFDMIIEKKIILLLSDIVLEELSGAPDIVQGILKLLPEKQITYISVEEEAFVLRDKYIKSGILNKKWMNDALHVALATINRADAIVSWNFKYIVHLDKIKSYNMINFENGYGVLTIVSPKEVI